MSTEFIYALFDIQNKDRFHYVGRSNDCTQRLAAHKQSGNPNGTLKEKWVYSVLNAGGNISFKILDCGSASQLQNKEELYIHNLRAAGHPLTNTRTGDSPLITFEGEHTFTGWNVLAFESAEWVKDDPKAKVGEVSAWINGAQFFRKGKMKLRFWHGELGDWAVGGFKFHGYQAAINMLTPGTEEHDSILRQNEWRKFK